MSLWPPTSPHCATLRLQWGLQSLAFLIFCRLMRHAQGGCWSTEQWDNWTIFIHQLPLWPFQLSIDAASRQEGNLKSVLRPVLGKYRKITLHFRSPVWIQLTAKMYFAAVYCSSFWHHEPYWKWPPSSWCTPVLQGPSADRDVCMAFVLQLVGN